MTSSKCALCDVEITKNNDTKEHIIPNAIGGRKKIKGFICRACNSTSGDSWDKELAKQLNPLSLFFGIKRERRDVPSQLFETTSGDKLKLHANGSMADENPVFLETALDDGISTRINIQARDIKEAKNMLKGVKKKYPKFDIEDAFSKLKIQSLYCSDMLRTDFSMGGPEAGRSIVKSALALAVYSGIPTESCIEATNYLNNEDSEACFGYFYELDLVKNRPQDTPIHCVSVKGCDKSNQVIAYVEYFGVQRMVLCLGSNYTGEAISNTYSINPITGKGLELAVELNLTNDEIREAYQYKKIPSGSVEEAFEKVIPAGMKAAYKKEQNRVVNKAIHKAFGNCGAKEGEMLMPENIEKIISIFMEEIEPFIMHNMSQSYSRD
ncbi:hypothetical protein JCM18902_2104 [Psychrobacter sp. JCM 18902]|uniref:HNH endonuclease n=1 Tax=Psychrobacter sp. JCM 18902 TaxID=1298607 RepID=UPI000431ACA1|nr:HNH endonuclease [Psychrobacter sp. JCM 18902]GAF59264.1 hypothetical protein JCM18902_2104 [Psychrobacter sp. JCM 18902]